MTEKCTNTSSEPSPGVMKPKPLESLNHLTVPGCIIRLNSLNQIWGGSSARKTNASHPLAAHHAHGWTHTTKSFWAMQAGDGAADPRLGGPRQRSVTGSLTVAVRASCTRPTLLRTNV